MYNKNNNGVLPIDTTVEAEDSSVSKIEASVGKYGGFYIAKYEAGIDETTENYKLETRKATDGSVKPLSQKGKGVWNAISRENAIIVSKAMIDENVTGAKSTLISGAAWDTTLQWMVKASDNKNENEGYDIDSTGKGFYSDISSSTSHTTGYYEVNNIYDMAGNIWDYTTENCMYDGNNYVSNRGGSFDSSGLLVPAAYRGRNDGNAYRGIGFRVVLYKN